MKDILIDERPRERLIRYGVKNLSNEELLSILLGTGNKDDNVKVLANKIIKMMDGVNNFNNLNYNTLTKLKGVKKAKACIILSAIELGNRIEEKRIIDITFNNPLVIYNYYKNILKDLKQEHFYCIYLDNKKKVIRDKLLFVGTINQSLIHPREIFKEAYLLSASAIICVHNHPSGDPTPSKQDILMTDNLVKIGNLMGINVVDHIIITNDKYYSLLEQGKL